MPTIQLDSLRFTQVCWAVREGQEIILIGTDEESNATNFVIPATIVANLELQGDEWDEEVTEPD